jgi:hypothetical protein
MKILLALIVMLASPSFLPSAALAQTQGLQPQQQNNAYFAWCDSVERILNNATRLANVLYGQNQFSQSKQVMVSAFQQALNASSLPGVFRPNAYRELVRTLDLIQTLETSNIPNAVLKEKMIAYVALNRSEVVLTVKNILDRPYVIPCRGGCNGGYGGYGQYPVNMNQFEVALASVARLQLQTAQNYSSQVIPGRRIQVYPLVDAATYFSIISKAAQWAAEDLSTSLFASTFGCAIGELQNLGQEAAGMASMAGDVYAVQFIHDKVDALKLELSNAPYGCGGGPRY